MAKERKKQTKRRLVNSGKCEWPMMHSIDERMNGYVRRHARCSERGRTNQHNEMHRESENECGAVEASRVESFPSPLALTRIIIITSHPHHCTRTWCYSIVCAIALLTCCRGREERGERRRTKSTNRDREQIEERRRERERREINPIHSYTLHSFLSIVRHQHTG